MTTDTGKAPTAPLDPPATPQPPMSRWVKHRKAIIATVATAVVVAGCIGVSRTIGEGPANTVMSYINAIRDGDMDAAFEYVRDRPTGEQARFLTPEAMSNEWELTGFTEHKPTEHLVPDIEVELSTHDTTVKGGFNTSQDANGKWYIEEPFVNVDFTDAPFDFAQVDGQTGPTGKYPLFPGSYSFYEDNGVLSFTDSPWVIVPTADVQRPQSTVVDFEWEPEPQAGSNAQDDLNAKVDACAESTLPNPPGCPFGFQPGSSPADHSGDPPYHVKDIGWRVVEYPTIKVSKQKRNDHAAYIFGVEVAQAGVIAVTGTEVVDGEDVSFRAECDFEPQLTYAHLTRGNEFEFESGTGDGVYECDFSKKDG